MDDHISNSASDPWDQPWRVIFWTKPLEGGIGLRMPTEKRW